MKSWLDRVERIVMPPDSAAHLLGSIRATCQPDFGDLYVYQEGAGGTALTQYYATSTAGEIALACGTKYAMATVVVERWSAAPPLAGGPWEDDDELPFLERTDKGPLVISSPAAEDERLDITGLGRARAQILARGRHAAPWDAAAGQPEEWLVRLWPDPERHDALWGGPRRIQGKGDQNGSSAEGWAFTSDDDVAHVLRWTAPGMMQPSVARIGDRMLLTRSSVRRALETIAGQVVSRGEPNPFPNGIPADDDSPVFFIRPANHGTHFEADPRNK